MSEINRVLRAVSRGYRTRAAIARAAHLTKAKTQTYLTRLMNRDLVESAPVAQRLRRRGTEVREYHLKNLRCLLMDIWK